MKKKETPKKVIRKIPRNAGEVPATKAMLFEMKGELLEKIESAKHEVKSEIHEVKSEIHRLAVLMEEQNAKNNVVLDALMGITERQDKLEDSHQELRSIVLNGPVPPRKSKDV